MKRQTHSRSKELSTEDEYLFKAAMLALPPRTPFPESLSVSLVVVADGKTLVRTLCNPKRDR